MAVTPALPLAGEGAYGFPVIQAKIKGKMPLPLPRGRLGGGCRTFACSTDFILCAFLTHPPWQSEPLFVMKSFLFLLFGF
ncbi:hypothetical protein CEK71_20390 [Methylovulum psychrotolerans]|uniref:Uncharacterized protein n=1 Tax=Methylovulum psychrotolerans TaxID=1704499 RepID=A0A1Z4C3Y4_9GAMM|nr:hypothetical protein CEK71_20390 [Methylovulum psychrotolerans]